MITIRFPILLTLFEMCDLPFFTWVRTHEPLWLEGGFCGTLDSSGLKAQYGVCDWLCGTWGSSQLKSWYEAGDCWLCLGVGDPDGLCDSSWKCDGTGLKLMLDVAGIVWRADNDCIFFWGNGLA